MQQRTRLLLIIISALLLVGCRVNVSIDWGDATATPTRRPIPIIPTLAPTITLAITPAPPASYPIPAGAPTLPSLPEGPIPYPPPAATQTPMP
jgi:hypothetical protein